MLNDLHSYKVVDVGGVEKSVFDFKVPNSIQGLVEVKLMGREMRGDYKIKRTYRGEKKSLIRVRCVCACKRKHGLLSI